MGVKPEGPTHATGNPGVTCTGARGFSWDDRRVHSRAVASVSGHSTRECTPRKAVSFVERIAQSYRLRPGEIEIFAGHSGFSAFSPVVLESKEHRDLALGPAGVPVQSLACGANRRGPRTW